MNIAVIPARGGSKRIPQKNIKSFCGKPMIAWSIEVAQKTSLFDHIIVSTDDIKIAKISKFYGAEIPFIRPAELSDDYVGESDVMSHAVSWMLERNWKVDTVCCIYATGALIKDDDLKKAYELFKTKKYNYVFASTSFSYPIQRAFKKKVGGGIEMFNPEHYKTRSQDLEEGFHDAGQFYFGKPEAWISMKRQFDKYSEVIQIPSWRVQDIDTLEDWVKAEIIFHQIHKL